MGRAFAVMMSQDWFSMAVRTANSKGVLLKCIDRFLDRTVVIPKPTQQMVQNINHNRDTGTTNYQHVFVWSSVEIFALTILRARKYDQGS